MATGGVTPRMSPQRAHECAVPGCKRVLAPHLVMCRAHWLLVPQSIRDRLNAEARTRPESGAHLRAIVDAVASLQVGV